MREKQLTNEQVIGLVTDDIQKSFGGREYSEIQKKVLIELIEIYGKRNFRRVAKRLIEEGTSKPYPVHFKVQLQNLPADQKPSSSFAGLEYEPCKHCKDTGKVFMKTEFVSFNEKPVLMLCNCPIGMQTSMDEAGLPRFDFQSKVFVDVFKVHLLKPEMPSSSLESKSFADFKHQTQHITDFWKSLIKNSQDYWKQNQLLQKDCAND